MTKILITRQQQQRLTSWQRHKNNNSHRTQQSEFSIQFMPNFN